MVRSEVIYHITLREGEPGIFIGNGLWIVLPGSRDENGSNRRVKENCMIREGARDFYFFSFFTVGGGDTISYRKRDSELFFCFWVPRRLSNDE